MTLCTLAGYTIVVRILMTGSAFSKLNPCERLKFLTTLNAFLMAFNAINFFVLAA